MEFAKPLPSYLVQRYQGWKATTYSENRSWYRRLATEGQRPRAMVISCCDSRVHVTSIFGADQGEFFIHRNIANLVPPYEPDGQLHGVSAALEFGVKVLKVKRIVVMGHAHCGGVNAMRTGAPGNCQDFVAPWVAQGTEAVRLATGTTPPAEAERVAEEAVVRLSLDNLRTFPWIAEREAAGDLELTGLHFGIADGVLTALTDQPRFEPLG